MREILFKAKRLDNNEWVQGNVFFADNGKCEICIGTPIVRITYDVDPETVCQYTGKSISQNDNTSKDELPFDIAEVFENDLIAVYSITYDDDDNPVRTRVAVVQVKWDDDYNMPFACCVEGDMETIATQCDISYLDGTVDYPFTFWLEYMENSTSMFWEWEVIGNTHDNNTNT